MPTKDFDAIEDTVAENAAFRPVVVEGLLGDRLGVGDGNMDVRFPSAKKINNKLCAVTGAVKRRL